MIFFFAVVENIPFLEGKELYTSNHALFCSELYDLFEGELSKKVDLVDDDKTLLFTKFQTMSNETRNLFVM